MDPTGNAAHLTAQSILQVVERDVLVFSGNASTAGPGSRRSEVY
ncbi:hypothetical protein [Streptomyces sp. NBC_01190]|nr:hypothetical protein OG519_17460 [Streptomyces sp. NBC_01190]